jgi:hypothetical protein
VYISGSAFQWKAEPLFLKQQKKIRNSLLALPSLMAGACQKLSVFMLTHLFFSLFYDATQ